MTYPEYMNHENEIQTIKTNIEAVKSKKIRAEMETEQAREQIEAMTKTLTEKFQVTTVEEAEVLVSKLRAKLENQIEAATTELQKISV